jgi:hypothetical protein
LTDLIRQNGDALMITRQLTAELRRKRPTLVALLLLALLDKVIAAPLLMRMPSEGHSGLNTVTICTSHGPMILDLVQPGELDEKNQKPTKTVEQPCSVCSSVAAVSWTAGNEEHSIAYDHDQPWTGFSFARPPARAGPNHFNKGPPSIV